MARKLSTIAPDWWDYTTLENDLISDAASLSAKDLEQLHSVIIEKIGRIEGIQNTETFVELEKTDKDPVYLSKN